ncbi:MAG: rRNA (cytidine-2'-O-)-methyltransferase, partial [Microgenomates group bacterium]
FDDIKQIKIKKETPTVIFFESPNRLLKTLLLIKEILGEKTQISLAREMTKIFEEFIRGRVDEVIKKLYKKKEIKGEVTVVVKF